MQRAENDEQTQKTKLKKQLKHSEEKIKQKL